jgi:farnesyl-diphosphate farnesyltransferase
MSSTIFDLKPEQRKYLDVCMEGVSRSFAVVVPFLETPLQDYVAAAYLICRVIDNIEDCLQPLEWKTARFQEISQLLSEPNQAAPILSAWEHENWPGLGPDQTRLMSATDGLMLWKIYAHIPVGSRASIQKWAQVMANGMDRLEDPLVSPDWSSKENIRLLRREKDYNEYCYIVAGTVGHMLTELVAQHYGFSESVVERLNSRAETCGRGLQKTNILKDFAEDLSRGICYLPEEWLIEAHYAPLCLEGTATSWKKKVIDDVLNELYSSTDYILALPDFAKGYRMASLLSYLPAMQTILLAAQLHNKLFTPDHHVKISRQVMAECVDNARKLIHDNDGILAYSRAIQVMIDACFA